jgi:hypothetical protein
LAAKNPEKLDSRKSIFDLVKLVGIDSSLAELANNWPSNYTIPRTKRTQPILKQIDFLLVTSPHRVVQCTPSSLTHVIIEDRINRGSPIAAENGTKKETTYFQARILLLARYLQTVD